MSSKMLVAESGLISPLGNRHPASTKHHTTASKQRPETQTSSTTAFQFPLDGDLTLTPCTLMCVKMGALEEGSERCSSHLKREGTNAKDAYYDEPMLISMTQSTFSDTLDNIDDEHSPTYDFQPLADIFCSLLRIERNIEEHDKRISYERISRDSSNEGSTIESNSCTASYMYNTSKGSFREPSSFRKNAVRMQNKESSLINSSIHVKSTMKDKRNMLSAMLSPKDAAVSYFKEAGAAITKEKETMDHNNNHHPTTHHTMDDEVLIPTSVPNNNPHSKAENEILQHQLQTRPSNSNKELPSKECAVFTAKICFMVSAFTEAEKFAALPEQPFASFDGNFLGTSESQVSTAYTDSLVELSIRDCASSLVLEGFFTGDSYNNGRAEVCIFRTLVHQKIIVCYKDTNKLQAKPVKKRGALKAKKNSSSSMNDIYPEFLKSYKCLEEEPIFSFLDNMLNSNPSYSLLLTGHSFGAALATMAAVRYATSFPDVPVSCHVFGSPRAGGLSFHRHADTLSNLQVIRFEKSGDPYVSLPSDYIHIGRTVVIGLDNEISKLAKYSNSLFVRHPRTSKNDLNSYIKAIEQCDFICW